MILFFFLFTNIENVNLYRFFILRASSALRCRYV